MNDLYLKFASQVLPNKSGQNLKLNSIWLKKKQIIKLFPCLSTCIYHAPSYSKRILKTETIEVNCWSSKKVCFIQCGLPHSSKIGQSLSQGLSRNAFGTCNIAFSPEKKFAFAMI